MINMQKTLSEAIVETTPVDMNKFKVEVINDFKGLMEKEFTKHSLISNTF